MQITFHYPESPYGRTYADVITKIFRMDSLPNYLSYGAPLAELRYKSLRYATLSDVSIFDKPSLSEFGTPVMFVVSYEPRQCRFSSECFEA